MLLKFEPPPEPFRKNLRRHNAQLSEPITQRLCLISIYLSLSNEIPVRGDAQMNYCNRHGRKNASSAQTLIGVTQL